MIPLCGLFIATQNGAVYGIGARRVDTSVPLEFTLVATSAWLFLGDLGSVIGSNVIDYVDIAARLLPWFND